MRGQDLVAVIQGEKSRCDRHLCGTGPFVTSMCAFTTPALCRVSTRHRQGSCFNTGSIYLPILVFLNVNRYWVEKVKMFTVGDKFSCRVLGRIFTHINPIFRSANLYSYCRRSTWHSLLCHVATFSLY